MPNPTIPATWPQHSTTQNTPHPCPSQLQVSLQGDLSMAYSGTLQASSLQPQLSCQSIHNAIHVKTTWSAPDLATQSRYNGMSQNTPSALMPTAAPAITLRWLQCVILQDSSAYSYSSFSSSCPTKTTRHMQYTQWIFLYKTISSRLGKVAALPNS